MSSNPGPISILTSALGYGVYVPAKIVQRQLAAMGIPSSCYIIEGLLNQDKRKIFQETKSAFASNFRLAQLATKMPIDYTPGLDPAAVQALYQEWDRKQVSNFLCLSGLWFEVLKDYQALSGHKNIRCCRMDAGHAPTWLNRNNISIGKTYYFFDLEAGKVNYTLNIPSLNPTDFINRPDKLLIHGGGWGLGDYTTKTQEVTTRGYQRKIILNDMSDYDPHDNRTEFYVSDARWDPLENKDDAPAFPPLAKIRSGHVKEYMQFADHHVPLKLMSDCKAVISKPGGMTLLDAIITATPFIYLEPMGPNEAGNQKLIDELKIGASFEAWKKNDFSSELLIRFHENITILRNNLPDFVLTFIADF